MYLLSDTEKLCDKPELQRLKEQDPILKVVKNDLRDKTKQLQIKIVFLNETICIASYNKIVM